MNLKLLIPAGIIALLVGLIVNLPAPVAAGWVQAQVPGLRLTGVSGSAFSGRVQYIGFNDLTLQDVSWQLSATALLLGRADVSLETSTDTGSIRGSFSRNVFGGMHVQGLSGSASLSWLGGIAGYRFVPLDGLLKIEDVDADIKGRSVTGAHGQVAINNANWLLIKPPVVFGSFTAALAADGKNNGIKIINSDGPLKVEGGAQLISDNAYSVDMRVRARAGASDELKKLLAQLGKPDAQGWYRVTERGNL